MIVVLCVAAFFVLGFLLCLMTAKLLEIHEEVVLMQYRIGALFQRSFPGSAEPCARNHEYCARRPGRSRWRRGRFWWGPAIPIGVNPKAAAEVVDWLILTGYAHPEQRASLLDGLVSCAIAHAKTRAAAETVVAGGA